MVAAERFGGLEILGVKPSGSAQVAAVRRPGSSSIALDPRDLPAARLITSQATSTRLNQRRVGRPPQRRGQAVVAKAGERHRTIPASPRSRIPSPSPSSDAEATSRTAPMPTASLEPPPPDGQCHPGVGAEGPDVALRHRAAEVTADAGRQPSPR